MATAKATEVKRQLKELEDKLQEEYKTKLKELEDKLRAEYQQSLDKVQTKVQAAVAELRIIMERKENEIGNLNQEVGKLTQC